MILEEKDIMLVIAQMTDEEIKAVEKYHDLIEKAELEKEERANK